MYEDGQRSRMSNLVPQLCELVFVVIEKWVVVEITVDEVLKLVALSLCD